MPHSNCCGFLLSAFWCRGGLETIGAYYITCFWAFTIKNRHIIGTIIAFGVAIGAHMLKVPSTTTVLTSNLVAQTAYAQVEDAEIGRKTGFEVAHVESVVRAYFADVPVLADIASCESHFTHVNQSTGEVLRGRANSSDVGVMQINEYYHTNTAEKMNLDLHVMEDNLRYARFLYEQEGTRPWNASKHCWGSDSLAVR